MSTIYINVKPYLKEFFMNQTNADGERIYTSEPVRLSPKNRIAILVDKLRRMPRQDVATCAPLNKRDEINYIAIEVTPDDWVKNDDKRIHLSKDSQSHIAKYIYNLFCATAYEYVTNHLRVQNEVFRSFATVRKAAYRDFCEQYGLMHADVDTIRRAFDRQKLNLATEEVNKIMLKKKDSWLSNAFYLPTNAR